MDKNEETVPPEFTAHLLDSLLNGAYDVSFALNEAGVPFADNLQVISTLDRVKLLIDHNKKLRESLQWYVDNDKPTAFDDVWWIQARERAQKVLGEMNGR